MTGQVAGDTPTGGLTTPPSCSAAGATAAPAPGIYRIRCSGAQAANYTIGYQPGTLTVHPRTVPPEPAHTLTLSGKRIVVIKRSTRTLAMTCTLDQPRLQSCRLKLKAGRRTLASARADAAPNTTSVKVTLPIGKQTRRLARRRGGQAATLTAGATQPGGPDLDVTIALLLLPRAVISAPADRMFKTNSATLPRNGNRYLRRLRALITGARRVTCTGHTDNRGATESNRRLGRARAKAVCTFLTRNTDVAARIRSQGETNPRAPNTTAAGRARNRYVSIRVRY